MPMHGPKSVARAPLQSAAEASRISRWAVFSLVGIVILFLALSIQKIWNVDIWWQLRTGQWILQHRAVPQHDEFSYTVRDHPWIELRWIFCVLAYWGWHVGGPALLILAQSAIMATAFGLIVFTTRPAAWSVPGAAMLALGICAGASRFVVRPEIITYLVVALFLVILHAAARGRMRNSIWLLPLLQVVWVNSHTVFVMGPVIAWTFALGELAQRRMNAILGWPKLAGEAERDGKNPLVRLIIIALLVTLACFINPYGIRGALFPITLFREIHKGSFLGSVIEEFRSPLTSGHLTPDIYIAGVLALLAGLSFVPNWRRLDIPRLALWAGHVYLACIAVRNVGLVAIVATWVALWNIADARTARIDQPSVRRTPFWIAAGHAMIGILCLAGAWYVASNRFAMRYGVQEFGLGIVNGTAPVSSTEFLLAHPEIRPNIYHDMADGSYLAWAAPERFPVLVDPRLEVYGEAALSRFLDLSPEQFTRAAAEYDVNVVMVNPRRSNSLGRWLRNSPDWTAVHLDEHDVVFVRDIPEHASLIAQFRVDPARDWQAASPEPDEAPSALRRSFGGVNRPWYSLGMARAFIMLGSLDNGEKYLRRALAACPDDGETRLTLAQFERSRGNQEAANALLAGLPLTSFDRTWGDRLLSQIAQDRSRALFDKGDRSAAMALLERTFRELPSDGELLTCLGQTYLDAGEFAKAVDAYRRLTRARPKNLQFWTNLGTAAENTGDRQTAVDAYRHVLEIEPENSAVKARLSELIAPLSTPDR